MKRFFTTLFLLVLVGASLFAQAPEKFTYQAVVRNANNSLVINSPVGVRVSILQGGVNGTLVYMETQTAVTNANGLITLQIGGGNVQQGNFADIDWAGGSYFLKTETDPAGGSNYSVTSTQQLLSVPYALYAKDAGNGFSGDYNDLTNTPAIPTVPTNVSAFTNDANYITLADVPAQVNADWNATLGAAEILNKPEIPTVPTNVSAFNNDAGYITMDSIPAIPTIPTNVSAFTNDAGYITTYTETDPQFNAWDKDYNDLINKPSIPTVPTNVSSFTNDAGYITAAQVPVQVNADWNATSGAAQILNKPTLFSGNYNDLTNKPVLFSGNYNDLTNKPTLFDGNYNSLTNRPNLAAVALSGNYNDLINKPAIPTAVGELTNNVGYITAAQVPAQVNADWNATSGAAQILNKPTLFSGNYNDLTNKPTLFSGNYNDLTNLPQIPQIPADISAFNNDAGYLTGYTETDPQFNAWDKDYNDLTNKPTIPTVPTNVSAFNNDAGYVTANDIPAYQVLSISNDTIYLSNGGYAVLPPGFDGDYNSLTNRPNLFSGSYNDLTDTPAIPTVPTNVSAFTNDAGYITMDSVPAIPTNVSAFTNDAGYITGYTETDPQFNAWDKDYNDLTNKPTIPTVPSNVSAFNNDMGYLTSYTETDPEFTAWDKDYNDLTNKPTIPTVPTNVSAFNNDVGYVTANDIPAYQVLSISNDTIYLSNGGYAVLPAGFDGDYNSLTNRPNLFSGSYNDLTDTPTIPTVPSNVSAFNNDAGYLTGYMEQQVLSISNDTIFLTGGSFVKLPTVGGCDTIGMAALMAQVEQLQRPSVSTLSVNNVSYHGARVTGRLFNSGIYWISGSGFCWSTSQNPTLDDNHITVTSELGPFSQNLTGLDDGTTYYVRAYATNSAGTTYGEQLSFTTISDSSPTVTTHAVSNITSTTATCGGNVTSDGGAIVTARGICWSTSQNPTVSSSHTTDGSGAGSFSSSITGLAANTTYYVRAYATNSVGTAYGEQQNFTTSPDVLIDAKSCPATPTVTDHEGNVYATVQIGDQCWTRENLRTTTSPTTGTYLIPTAVTGYTYTGKMARWYNNDSATYAPMNYGLLYNWNAAVDMFNTAYGETSENTNGSNAVSVTFNGHCRGICPEGWHLPSDAEWTAMTDYVSSHSEYVCGGDTSSIAKALADSVGWNNNTNTCCIGSNQSANNATGFSAVPAGRRFASAFVMAGDCTYFWSSSQSGSAASFGRRLASGGDIVLNHGGDKGNSYSVRCLRDDSSGGGGSTATLPMVTTNTVSSVTATTATCRGNVTSDGGAYITARGVCWSTSQNPTISDNHTTDGSGMGSYSSSITGLTANTTYYVRAYATNSVGTAYGATLNIPLIDAKSCPSAPTVTDHEGNIYATVQIGNQCWMRDNLRTATSPSTGTYLVNKDFTSGTSIASSYTGKMARWYNNDSATYAPMNYGLLYNWNAAVDTFNTAYGETSVNTSISNAVSVSFTGHRRGICPAGWHLPSYAEWTAMTDYVSSQSEYVCGGDTSYIAKALADSVGWNSHGGSCYSGDQSVTANNATGFSAVPAGYCYGSSFGNAGYRAHFWSSSQLEIDNNPYYADYRHLAYNYANVDRGPSNKHASRSVRCLRDNAPSGGGNTATLPTVTSNAVSSITATSATCGGNISADGGASVTARGVCWSTSQNPTVSDSHTTDGNGTGSFSSSITGLTTNTTYYVRAYATNSVGTAYGAEVSFTTIGGGTPQDGQPCPGTPTVTDHEGNVYATVHIGNQCWMRDNLRTTTSPSTGTYLIPTAGTDYTYTGKQAFWYNNDSATYAPMNYGLLYNWNAAVDTFNTAYGELSGKTNPDNVVSVSFTDHRRGICPVGWHLPSDAEWTAMTDYVSSQSEYVCGGSTNNIAKALADSVGWNSYSGSCYSGDQSVTANNATGFSAVPAGYCYGSSFGYAGTTTCFWSSSQNEGYPLAVYDRFFNYHDAGVYRHEDYKYHGFSVRCLCDNISDGNGSTATLPTVTTSTVSSITATSATCGGNVTSDGGASVTARGVCWGTSQNPTVSDSHTTNGNGTGSYSSSITGLTTNTTYYVRAYARNSVGTAYGAEVSFTTLGGSTPQDGQPCLGTPTVTDHEGNVYATVQIGNQCWMRDNLRTTTSPSTGTYLIPAAGTESTYTGKQAHWYNNDSTTYAPMNYGLLYNWNAAVDTFNTSYGETSVNMSISNAVSVSFISHRRGICPAGWHLPSDAEWNTMEATVSGPDWQTSYETGTDYRGSHAGKLAGGNNWTSSTTSGAPGDYGNTDRNVSGFSAVPAGGCYGTLFDDAGDRTSFWSSTLHASFQDGAYGRSLYYYYEGMDRYDYGKNDGFSVRCLRD